MTRMPPGQEVHGQNQETLERLILSVCLGTPHLRVSLEWLVEVILP